MLSSFGESVFQLVVVLVIFALVLVLCYYTTRFIGGYQRSVYKDRNLAVVDTARLANNKYVQIVRAGEDNYFVVAVGKDEVTLLGTIDGSSLKEIPIQAEDDALSQYDFKKLLDKVTQNKHTNGQ